MQSCAPASRELVVGSWPGEEFRDNPYIGLFCKQLAATGVVVESVPQPWQAALTPLDVLHIHWPEQVFWGQTRARGMARAGAALAALASLRARGVRLVWCVHNLEPHDAGATMKRVWPFYAGTIAHLVHGYLTLSPSTVPLARERFRGLENKPSTYIWHSPYEVDTARPASDFRARHGIAKHHKVLAFVGAVRRYKGVLELVRCFREVEDPGACLVIAGEAADAALRAELEQLARGDSRVRLLFGRLSEAQLLDTVLAADAIVLPFDKTLHSGSLIYALSCGKAVITPRTPYATDLERVIGGGWVRLYDPPLSARQLASVCSAGSGTPNLEVLRADENGQRLADFYRSLRTRPRAEGSRSALG